MTAHAFDALADERRWVAWCPEVNGTGKPKKQPYYLNGNGEPEDADPSDPATWGTRAEAEACAQQLGQGAGIGRVLGDLGTGVFDLGADLDSCIGADGKLLPWAEQILARLATYAERSPSGTGVKALLRCKKEHVRPFLDLIGVAPDKWGMKQSVGNAGGEHGPAIEVYAKGRYFTTTEAEWPGHPDQIALLDWPILQEAARAIRDALGAQVGCAQGGGAAGSLGEGEARERIRDESRSARALAIAGELHRAGHDWDEIFEALETHSETAAWYRERGVNGGRHELRNIIARVVEHDVAVARLAKLSGEEYARRRSEVTAELQIGNALVDQLVERKRQRRKVTAAPLLWAEPAKLLEVDAVPAFPVEFLPGALGTFACDVAERMQCPVDFVGIPLIIEAATLIGKGFKMAPKAYDDWTERPCLWGGVVADIGKMKSPALRKAFQPMDQLQSELTAQYARELREYKKNKELPPASRKPMEPPQLRRLSTSEPTQEALVDLLEQNPRGLLLFRDELSGWFASFNQYRPGADRQFYLECHSGGSYSQDRKSGSVSLKDLYLNVCGSVQPEIVRKVLGGGDHDGMTARFSLLVWPDDLREFCYVDRSPNEAAQRETEQIMRQLFELKPPSLLKPASLLGAGGVLRFDGEAQHVFSEWYTRGQLRLREGTESKAFVAHLGKYAGLFARLAIVHHLIRVVLSQVKFPQIVEVTTATAVRDFIDGYLEPHARRIYRHLGGDPACEGARRIARWIVDEKIGLFSARDVRRHQWSGLTTQEEVDRALDYLSNVAGWVRSESEQSGPRGGRPSVRWLVNPRVKVA